MKIPQKDLKKSLFLFNMVDERRIGVYRFIYKLVRECLIYFGDCYGINVIFKRAALPNNEIPKETGEKIIEKKLEKKYRNSSAQYEEPEISFHNVLAEKVLNVSNLHLSSKSLVEDNKSVTENPLNHQEISIKNVNPEAIVLKPDDHLKELLKKPKSFFKPNALTKEKKISGSKQQLKNQKFLIDSRVNKRIHEKFLSFVSKKQEKVKIINESFENKTQRIMDDFIKNLPCAEVSSSTLQYLEYLSTTKEFEKYLKNY